MPNFVEPIEDKLWESKNTIQVSDKHLEKLEELNRLDDEIAKIFSKSCGAQFNLKHSFLFRVARRLAFEYMRRIYPFLRKGINRLSSKLFLLFFSKNKLQDGDSFYCGNELVQIVSLDAPNAYKTISESRATLIVLTRKNGIFLRRAAKRFRKVNLNEQQDLWLTESRSRRGFPNIRSSFSKLLLKQMDIMGPVILVRKEIALMLLENYVQESWFLVLGLCIDNDKIGLIDETTAIADYIPVKPASEQNLLIGAVTEILQCEQHILDIEVIPGGKRKINYKLDTFPLISIIIPTKGSGIGGTSFLENAVSSISDKTDYPNFEILIVADKDTSQQVVDRVNSLDTKGYVIWVPWDQEFNFSQKVNLGAVCSKGEYLLFLNDDIEVINSQWLSRMLELQLFEDISYCGALLFFEDQTIQHAGHIYEGGAGHLGFGEPYIPGLESSNFGLDYFVAGATAACSMIERKIFNDLGGFSPKFPNNYNDVDLSLKLRNSSHSIGISGHSMLYHFESKTRDPSVKKEEIQLLHSRWGKCMHLSVEQLSI